MTVWLRDLPDLFAAAGLRVVVLPGYDTRSRRSGGFPDPGPLGMSLHHTAGGLASGGIGGAMQGATTHQYAPIDNFRLDRDGTLYCDAAGASNTVGAGGPLGPIPKDMGNALTVGLEICNNGVGEAYTPEIQEALPVYCDVLYSKGMGSWGWEPEIPVHRLFAHFEWAPTRKIDPAGPARWWQPADRYGRWDMDFFRDDIRALIAPPVVIDPPIPPPSEEDDMAFNLRITDDGTNVTDAAVFTVSGVFATWQRDGNAELALEHAGLVSGDKLVRRAGLKGLTLVGPAPDDDNFAAYAGSNLPGRTRGSDFGARLR